MSSNPNSPFNISMVYKTLDGRDIIIVGEQNPHSSDIHTVIGHDGVYRHASPAIAGKVVGDLVDKPNPDNLVPDSGRSLEEMGRKFVWDNWLSKLFDVAAMICDLAQINFIITAHVPSEKDANLCHGQAGLNDDAPDTMKEILELLQSRPPLDDQPTPAESCDTDSVDS